MLVSVQDTESAAQVAFYLSAVYGTSGESAESDALRVCDVVLRARGRTDPLYTACDLGVCTLCVRVAERGS